MQKRILVTLHTTCGSVGQGWLDYGSKILWDMEPEKEIKAAILSRVDAQTLDVLELVKIDGDAWRALEINKGLHRLLEITEVVEVDSRSETVAKGSAICAFKCDAENLVVYYEGNLYGASNLHRFEDRASVAYGRLTQRAPTVAMAMVPAREFVVIGQMTPGHLAIDKPSLLSQWNQEMAD